MEKRPIHFEFYSSDPAASVAFFEQAFEWSFDRWDEFPYWLATTGKEAPGINGAVGEPQPETGPYTMVTVQVPELEAAIEACEGAGGVCTADIMEIPGVGRWIRIREPGGNELGMIEPAGS